MQFEDVFKYMGKYGRYQKILTHIVCFIAVHSTLSNIGTIFLNGSMDHFCYDADNVDNTSCSSDYECGLANLEFPPDDESTAFVNETACRMYVIDGNDTEITKCEHGWTYDRSHYDSTIVSEFDLVCENSYKVSLAASSFLFGYFFGSILFGWISDYFGRKNALIISLTLKIITGIAMSFAPSYWFYFVFRLLNGCMNIAVYICLFVYVNEIVAPSKRALVSALTYIYWCLGYLFLAIFGYFIRSWRNFYLTVCLVGVPFIIIYLFIPESPRWLLLKNRPEEAKAILQKIAKFNERELPDELLDEIKIQKDDTSRKGSSFIKIFRLPNMRKKTIILVYCWFTVVLSYYGLTYNVEKLDIDIYLGTIVAGVIEFVAAMLTWYAIQKIGRRNMMACCFIVAGSLSFINIWIPSHMGGIRTGISMTGRFFLTCVFSVIYTFTSELYSTDVRSTGVGFCSFVSRFAGVLAPQIIFIQKLWTPLPLVAFSFTSVSAGALALLLPETLNFPLPQTVEEAELVTRAGNRRKTNKGFQDLKLQPQSS